MSTFKQLKIIAPILISKALKKDSSQRKRVNAFLVKQMGESKGLWLKVGQMLSLHPENWEVLDKLPISENIPSIPKQDFHPYLINLFKENNFNFEDEIKEVHYPGLAASLSQVHQIQTKDNETYAFKVQLPGIKDIISEQLEVFGLAEKIQTIKSEKKSFSIKAYQENIQKSFMVELDYDQERKNIKDLKYLESIFPEVKVPSLHPKLQANEFICMSFLQGDNWQTVINEYSEADKRTLAKNLLKQVLYQYFILGVCQGDFHPGNFLFKREQGNISILWLDLGQCLRPKPLERKAIYLAINSLIYDKDMSLGPLFSAWGFDLDKLSHISTRLPLLLQKIFFPFLQNMALNLSDWKLKAEIDQILGEDKWWFRTAGSPDLFLSIRCWIGLFSMLEALNVPIFFSGIWRELENVLSQAITQEPLPEVELEKVSFKDLAKKLSVKVYKNEEEIVHVTLPSRAILDIEDFISSETKMEMNRLGINLNKIVSFELKKGLIPGTIIDFKDKDKRYLVTLE